MTPAEAAQALFASAAVVHLIQAAIWPCRRLRPLVVALSLVPCLLPYPLLGSSPGIVAVVLAMAGGGQLVRVIDAAVSFPEATRKQFLLFLFFLMRHPSRDARPDVRTPPARRFARGLALFALWAVLALWGRRLRLWTWAPYLDDLWLAVEFSVFFLANVEVVTPIARRLGVHELLLSVDGLMPDFAGSPSLRVFWGRRWNPPVHNMLRRAVFVPLDGRRRPVRATLAVFAVSGLLHAVPLLLGGADRLLWLALAGGALAFFLLHGAGVLIEGLLPRRLRQRWPARAVVYGTFLATLPLYPAPLFALAGVHGRPVESLTPVLVARALGL